MLAKDLVRPIGMPLKETGNDPPPSRFGEIGLKGVVLGGHTTKYNYNKSELQIAGEAVSPAEWIRIRGRIDSLLIHTGLVEKGPEPNKTQSSNFLSVNLDTIIARQRGRIRTPPFWLKWLFDGVITKEELNDER